MTEEFTQDGRLLRFTSPLGKDVLLVNDVTISEGISRPFVLELGLMAQLSKSSRVVAQDMLGKRVSLNMQLPQGRERLFNGIVSRFAETDRDSRFRFFHCQVVPWLWLLTLRSNCRIFQRKKVIDIVESVMGGYRLAKFRHLLADDEHIVRDYCVQYRETDFNFVSRLLEDEGIFYFFEHGVDPESNQPTHVMVMTDSTSRLNPCPHQSEAPFLPVPSPNDATDRVTFWQKTRSLRPGKVTLRDYHFELSDTIQEAVRPTSISAGDNAALEIYDFPGGFAQKFKETSQRLGDVSAEGRRTAQVRMQEEESPFVLCGGGATCRSFASGFRFDLVGHSTAMDGSYVLTSVQHSASQTPPYVSGSAAALPYQNSFTCVPAQAPFRPARTTPKPVIQGIQTAEVSGPKDASGKYKEDIHVDSFGRVKVIFHWDRDFKSNVAGEEKSDAENSSCWVRVAQIWAGKNFGGIFTPRCGDEVVVAFVEGDPDRPLIVGSVYNSTHKPPYPLPERKTRSGIKTRSVKQGTPDNFNEIYFEDEKGKEVLHVHAERTLSTVVEASESRSVGGSRSTTIGRDETLTIKKGNRTETLEEGNDSLTVKMGGITIAAPLGTYDLSAKEVKIAGTTKVTITCGASSIEMTPASIKITSPMVEINGTGTATLKGAMVKINC